ncbi:MAG: magnesium transporter, partial [Zetaproteobacteria bacterium]
MPQAMEKLSAEAMRKLYAESPERLREELRALSPAAIAAMLADLRDPEMALKVLALLEDEKSGEVLLELPEVVRREILRQVDAATLSRWAEALSSDDAADLLLEAEPLLVREVLARIRPSERREIESLLRYGEETAGGLMQAELFKVRADWTVGRVIEVLRRWGRGIENLNYVYVVDDDDRLVGVLPLVQLLVHDPNENIAAIADRSFPRVSVGQDQAEVARLFEEHDVLVMPVVDEQGRLVGRITADDIIDVVQDEATEDIYRLAHLSDEDDLAEPVPTTARRRSVWLFVNLITAILASSVVRLF